MDNGRQFLDHLVSTAKFSNNLEVHSTLIRLDVEKKELVGVLICLPISDLMSIKVKPNWIDALVSSLAFSHVMH